MALVRQSGRGRQSGVPVVFHYFALHTIRDGKVRKIEFFRHRADALQAAGLGEQAMSANLDLVRSIYADFERGDFSRADWADPQIEYVVMDGPSPGTFTGLTEIATAVREILSPWKDLHDVIDEYRELDDERVLVLLRHDLRGKTSGLGLDASWTRGAEIVHIKRGRVTRIVKYFDRDHAIADLGLAAEGEEP